jgi:hypothetical protein
MDAEQNIRFLGAALLVYSPIICGVFFVFRKDIQKNIQKLAIWLPRVLFHKKIRKNFIISSSVAFFIWYLFLLHPFVSYFITFDSEFFGDWAELSFFIIWFIPWLALGGGGSRKDGQNYPDHNDSSDGGGG